MKKIQTPLVKNKKDQLLHDYIKLQKTLKRHVTIQDLKAFLYTKRQIEHYYGSLSELEKQARLKFPNVFSDVNVEDILTPKKLKDLRSVIGNQQRFIITTAVVGCSVDENFYNALKNYCKRQNAELLILLASDPASSAGCRVDRRLRDEHIVVEEMALNSNIYLSTIKLSAKHIDPTTSLGRIGQRNGSFIYASPKQRLKMVPVANSKSPHALMTTGAITSPHYNTQRYMSERTAYIADNDHIMGAIIVEVVDNEIYHFRQIQADKNGSFIDLGIKYQKNGQITTCIPEAFVLGDWHSGETDPQAAKAWAEIVCKLKPKSLILHDAFNGMSINHHEQHNLVLRAIRAHRGELNLEQELKILANDLDKWSKIVSKIVIVKSNHDEFLKRYLDEGIYVKDPFNHYISLKLAQAMLEGRDPLRYGVELAGLKNKDRIVWLQRDQDYKVARIQLGAHGDKGPNGSRGSIMGMESAYGNSVTGHTHTPEILRGAWGVGTSSFLKLSYNSGPSSWLHSSCLVYANGSRQLIHSIDGFWKL